MIVAYLTVSINFISCAPTDEGFLGNTPTPPAKGTLAELVNTNISHDWKIDNQLVTDEAIASANIIHYKDGVKTDVPLSKLVHYTISWVQPEKMRRSSPDFRFLEKIVSDKKITGTQTSGNITSTTTECNHRFDFVGLSLKFQTTNHRVQYTVKDKDGNEIVIAYNEEDSLSYKGQEKELIEKFWLDKEEYQRMKTYFNFDIYRTDYPSKSQKIQRFRPFIITESPVNVDPGKDIFEGVIPIDGTERLYKSGFETYTAERQVYEFWSVSGKKPTPTLLKTTYEVKQWMSDPQPAKIIPSILIGNPKIEPSTKTGQPYPKVDQKDYEFEKTTATWNNTWLNGYSDQVFASSERAWWMVNGIRIIEMPFSTHQNWFKNFIPNEGVEKTIDGKVYMNYQGVFNFNGNYNGDPYELSQNQEFNIDKSIDPKPDDNTLISEEIIKKLTYSNGNAISTITWAREYSLTGKIDSVATQVLKHSTKLEDKKTFIRPNNSFILNETLDPVQLSHKNRTENETGHAIDTWTIRHGFDFDFFTSNVEETYETASTTYKGKTEEFLSDVPKVVFSGIDPPKSETITGQDGKRYQRTNYVIKYKENFCDVATILRPEIAIDVLDTSTPETDYIEDWKVTKSYDSDTQLSTLKFWIKRHLSGEKDSIATQTLKKIITLEPKKQLRTQTAELIYNDVLNPDVTTDTRTENGNLVTKVTTVNKFLFNHFTSKVTTEYETATTTFQGTTIDYKVPTAPVIVYSGNTPTDLGIIKGDDGKDYNRTNYVLKYKETFNAQTIPHTAEADIDVADIQVPVTRTKWSTLDKKIEKYDDSYQKSSFILHEEFSDGSQTNTNVFTLLDTHGASAPSQTVKLASANLKLIGITPGKATTTTRQDGDKITITVKTTPVTIAYEGVKAISTYVDATARYVDGEINVEFMTSQYNFSSGGFDNPYLKEVSEGDVKYDRYDCLLKLNATYNNDNYNTTAPVLVDVKKAPATRTFWEARDKGLQYISGRQFRTFFTFYEKFSDGTEKNTPVETYINVYGTAPDKRNLKLPSSEFTFIDLTPGMASTGNRTDGPNISIVTSTVPYSLVYSNKDGGNVTSEFKFISEEATYRNGDAAVEFLTDKWNIANVDYAAPLQGEIKDGIDTYRRYNAAFNISGTYYGHNYPLSARIDVDVLKGNEPNTPPEWGKILWDKTKLFGGGSYAWKKVGNAPVPVNTFSFIVEQGVVNVTEGRVEFTKMDIARINSRVSAVINVGGGDNYYTASTLEVMKENGVNSYWSYIGFDGASDLEVNSVDILKIEGISITKPFIFTPTDAGTMDRYVYSDGRLLIYYKNQLIYDGTSEK